MLPPVPLTVRVMNRRRTRNRIREQVTLLLRIPIDQRIFKKGYVMSRRTSEGIAWFGMFFSVKKVIISAVILLIIVAAIICAFIYLPTLGGINNAREVFLFSGDMNDIKLSEDEKTVLLGLIDKSKLSDQAGKGELLCSIRFETLMGEKILELQSDPNDPSGVVLMSPEESKAYIIEDKQPLFDLLSRSELMQRYISGVSPELMITTDKESLSTSPYYEFGMMSGQKIDAFASKVSPKLIETGSDVAFNLSAQDVKATVHITLDGKDIAQCDIAQTQSFVPEFAGVPYLFTIEAEKLIPGGVAIYNYAINVIYNLKPTIELSSTEVDKGDVLTLTAKYFPEDSEFEVTTDLRYYPDIAKLGSNFVSVIPVRLTLSAGDYYVEVVSGEYQKRFTVTVKDTEFEIQRLEIDDELSSSTINNQKAINEYNQKVTKFMQNGDDEIYWDGEFVFPTEEAEITTSFAMERYINDDPESSTHGGIDIAADDKAPVFAANNGKVVFAENLQLTGNTVIIEHGLGLKTWYYHMDSLNVQEGDVVTKGQEIGKVGSTGFSTGPHLHFEARIYNFFINPWKLFEGITQ